MLLDISVILCKSGQVHILLCSVLFEANVGCPCSAASELLVEEDVQYVELEIQRSFGTFGEISVDLDTVAGSAISQNGEGAHSDSKNHSHFCVFQAMLRHSV